MEEKSGTSLSLLFISARPTFRGDDDDDFQNDPGGYRKFNCCDRGRSTAMYGIFIFVVSPAQSWDQEEAEHVAEF